jgi:hypothetical protein
MKSLSNMGASYVHANSLDFGVGPHENLHDKMAKVQKISKWKSGGKKDWLSYSREDLVSDLYGMQNYAK